MKTVVFAALALAAAVASAQGPLTSSGRSVGDPRWSPDGASIAFVTDRDGTPQLYRSVGYGQRFVQMNRADWGGGDFTDVMAGVDSAPQF